MKSFLLFLIVLVTSLPVQGFRPIIRKSPTLSTTELHAQRKTNLHHTLFASMEDSSLSTPSTDMKKKYPEKRLRNIQKRWITGLTLGLLATLWIFAGNGVFTCGFLITTIISQLEYYEMMQNTGVVPAKKIGITSSLLCYFMAASFPLYHEACLPFMTITLMTWLLLFKKTASSIAEISGTFLGMFYLGYLPSFWVRLRRMGEMSKIMFPQILRSLSWTQADTWTHGAVITWWTWTSIVFADVGAYFVGKNFGKTKLAQLSSAAGAASPNKTVEGAIGGFLACTALITTGAYFMNWPNWLLSGTIYGLLMSSVALLGDLTASMMKRDAKMKDSGKVLPGHGGLLDRIDSYMLTAPTAYFFIEIVLKSLLRAKKVLR